MVRVRFLGKASAAAVHHHRFLSPPPRLLSLMKHAQMRVTLFSLCMNGGDVVFSMHKRPNACARMRVMVFVVNAGSD